MCLFNKTGEELNEYGRERTKQHFSNAKNPSYVSSRRVLAIENKNSVRMNRVFHVSPIFGKRRCAPLAATHIHTQRRLLRGLCKLHVCIRTLKKHFMQFFISLNFLFLQTTTRRRRPNAHHRHVTRQDKFFFLCLQQQVFLLDCAVPCNFSKNVVNVENDTVGIGRQTNSVCTMQSAVT